MFHGGTSFGFMSGANWNNNNYLPDVTSYDYGAPLDEAGHPTPKFLAFRKIFAKYATCDNSKKAVILSGAKNPRISSEAAISSATKTEDQTGEACLPPIPDPPPVITIPTITLTESTPLWDNLPKPIHSDTPKPMEQFDQAYGYILYRHQLPAAISGRPRPRRTPRLRPDLPRRQTQPAPSTAATNNPPSPSPPPAPPASTSS